MSAGGAAARGVLASDRPAAAGYAPAGAPWRVAAEHLRRNRGALTALGAVTALALVALLAPALAPYDPTAQLDIVALKAQAPSLAHPFGTDAFSRDVLSRVLYGARVSLGVAVLAVVLSATLGTAYGAVAGFYGGRLDAVMMRLIDALLAVPRILLLIGVLALWGRIRLPLLVVLLGLTGWFGVSRLVRAEVRALRGQDFVASARALGAGDLRLLLRHILPNALAPVIVAATLGVGHVVIVEAGLSYLGIGVQQPQASWGNIIQEGGDQVATMWWMSLFPGLLIVVTVMAFTALGDALRDASDPRQLDGP
jgi:peptide/nickel transport system permease protein